ncbi:MAG: DUF202 domain-containing protein [Iamia sp.]
MSPDAGAPGRPRPEATFDDGLQHERTALAWERTAIAMMVAGLILARAGALRDRWVFAGGGLVQTVAGGAVLVWAGAHYDDLHGPLRRGDDVVHPLAARLVGVAAMVGSSLGLVLAVLAAVAD